MILQIDSDSVEYVFIGIKDGDEFLMVAAPERVQLRDVISEITAEENEKILVYQQRLHLLNHILLTGLKQEELLDKLSELNNEMVNAQRLLVKKNLELEELSNQKSKFIGTLAHDIRNPLASMFLFSTFMRDKLVGILDSEELSILDDMTTNSEYMLGLVSDLLELGSNETGELKLNLSEVDLKDLLERSITLIGRIAEQKEISINLVSEGASFKMMGDELKLLQVFQNLLSNAVKFSPTNSQIEITLVEEEGEISISFEDQGKGIPEEEIPLLFNPYQVSSVKPTAGEKSIGLGLTISKNIVEGHKGRITVRSKVGKGTTFTVYLPKE
jgi:signal transduction histidine kinase